MVACWYMDCFAALAMTRELAMTSEVAKFLAMMNVVTRFFAMAEGALVIAKRVRHCERSEAIPEAKVACRGLLRRRAPRNDEGARNDEGG